MDLLGFAGRIGFAVAGRLRDVPPVRATVLDQPSPVDPAGRVRQHGVEHPLGLRPPNAGAAASLRRAARPGRPRLRKPSTMYVW